MLAAANCITIDGFLQHSRKLIKKPERSWRVSAGLLAYAHEPANNKRAGKNQNRNQTVNNTNQCKLKNQ